MRMKIWLVAASVVCFGLSGWALAQGEEVSPAAAAAPPGEAAAGSMVGAIAAIIAVMAVVGIGLTALVLLGGQRKKSGALASSAAPKSR